MCVVSKQKAHNVVHKFVCVFKQTHKKVILAVIRWCLGV